LPELSTSMPMVALIRSEYTSENAPNSGDSTASGSVVRKHRMLYAARAYAFPMEVPPVMAAVYAKPSSGDLPSEMRRPRMNSESANSSSIFFRSSLIFL